MRKFTGSEGALLECSDGYLDPGEVCDPGSPGGNHCCTGDCHAYAEGELCDGCTRKARCRQGSCVGKHGVRCDLCVRPLSAACKEPTESNAATIQVTNLGGNANDAVGWRWRRGAATSKAEFGDPRTTTGYALCIYGSFPAPILLSAEAPAGRGWRETPNGFEYRRPSGAPEGVRRIVLRAGTAGKSRIAVDGRGRHLVAPRPPLTEPVAVQLRRLDGASCWTASAGRVLTNHSHQFVARGD